nr:TolC family outer membrane protein [uncultured Undibacterium sp.]
MASQWNRLKVLSAACMLCCMSIEQASATGLLEAYQAALKNDPMHRAAKAELIAGLEYETLGRSGLLPSVQYSYSTSKNKGESVSPDVFGRFNSSNLDYTSKSKAVNLRQPLFNLDAYARFEQGRAQTNYSVAQFDAKSSELLLRVVSAYTDAKYAEDQVGLYAAQRDSYAEQRKLNDRLFSKGEGTKTDMLETQAKLDVAEALLLEASDNLQNAKNTLSSITGLENFKLDKLSGNFKPEVMTDDFEAWRNFAQNKNPEIASARFALEVAETEISKSRAGHAPRIDLNASYSHGLSETVSTRNQDLNIRTVGVQLIIPIYSGGYVNATTKQAVARKDKARAELDATTAKVMIDLRKQYSAVKSGVIKIDGLQKSVDSASALVEATRQSIKGGIRINADLLNAEQQLVAAKRDLAYARYSYLLAYLKLRVAAGTATVDDLRTVAGYFTAS